MANSLSRSSEAANGGGILGRRCSTSLPPRGEVAGTCHLRILQGQSIELTTPSPPVPGLVPPVLQSRSSVPKLVALSSAPSRSTVPVHCRSEQSASSVTSADRLSFEGDGFAERSETPAVRSSSAPGALRPRICRCAACVPWWTGHRWESAHASRLLQGTRRQALQFSSMRKEGPLFPRLAMSGNLMVDIS